MTLRFTSLPLLNFVSLNAVQFPEILPLLPAQIYPVSGTNVQRQRSHSLTLVRGTSNCSVQKIFVAVLHFLPYSLSIPFSFTGQTASSSAALTLLPLFILHRPSPHSQTSYMSWHPLLRITELAHRYA